MFPFAEEQAALCRDRLVIRSVKPMENKKRKKWNGYLAAGLFMTGLAVFLGILGYFWNRQFRKGYFFKSDAGIGNNACDQHIGRPFFNCGRCFVRSIYRIFRRHFR